MDKGVVIEKVKKLAPELQVKFGLEHWEIRFGYDATLGDAENLTFGICSVAYDYDDAKITLNPEAFDDDEDLEGTIRHEMFHIVLSPFDLFSEIVDILEINDESKKLLRRLLINVREKSVINLERMYKGLTKANELSTPS